MFSFIFFLTTSRLNPKIVGTNLLQFFIFLRGFFRSRVELDLLRLKRAIQIPAKDIRAGSFDRSIQLVFVSINKDFPVLIHSIRFARKSVANYRYAGAKIIVPDSQVIECEELLTNAQIDAVTVVPESSLLSPESIALLRETFASRWTWVLQQILKVQSVLNSESDTSLIVDSDTLLLNKRPWFSNNGSQILTPSYEFNHSYYDFLSGLNISERDPEYTFISHHMLMQKAELAETLSSVGLEDEKSLVTYICKNADLSVESPICVEYELYAQSLMMRSPEKCHLGLWSNVSISRTYADRILNSKLIMLILRTFFHSLSLHSWSEKSK